MYIYIYIYIYIHRKVIFSLQFDQIYIVGLTKSYKLNFTLTHTKMTNNNNNNNNKEEIMT